MLMTKACPRCSGDLIRVRDPHDDEAMFSCVQCGFASYRPLSVSAVVPKLEPVAAANAPRSEYDDEEDEETAA